MATKKRLMGYDPITLESFTQHMTKHREPYDQYDMGYVDAFEQIENWLEYYTVDAVEVVHGRWVPYHEADIGYDEYGIRCSNCRLEFENHEVNFPINYCPNCGAKMDGDGNG